MARTSPRIFECKIYLQEYTHNKRWEFSYKNLLRTTSIKADLPKRITRTEIDDMLKDLPYYKLNN
jgi:hypothetical protein